MAPISNIVELGITAPPDSPVTIAAVKTTTFQRYRIENGIVVQCQYGAGGEAETTIYPDLDSPQRRVPMDTDGDDEADTEMPGGRFVIRAGEFEWLTISAQGTKGYVYEIGFELTVVVNGQASQETIGTRDSPIRLALVSDYYSKNGLRAFDWHQDLRRWLSADVYRVLKELGE